MNGDSNFGGASHAAPRVSVVIPAFNRARLLPRALASVFAQNFDDLETVVVDDGSADDTVAVVGAIAASDPRVRLIRHEVNKGEAAARNTGVLSARGEYVAFLDSDDEWLPGKLLAQVAVLDDSPREVAGVVSGQRVVHADGATEPVRDWTDRLPINSLNLLTRGCGVSMGNTFVVRRSVYDEVGFYEESMPIFVDLDWLCRLADRYAITKVPDVFVQYHKAPMRSGVFLEQGVARFYAARSEYISRFSSLQRARIRSCFLNYVSMAYAANGPRRAFIKNRIAQFALNPLQPLTSYAHLLLVLLGVWSVGRAGSG